MATYVAVDGGLDKRSEQRKHQKSEEQYYMAPGPNQILICPPEDTKEKSNKVSEDETPSKGPIIAESREVNVIPIRRPEPGSTDGSSSPNVENYKATDVTRKDKNRVSLVKIRDPNSPRNDTPAPASKPTPAGKDPNTRSPGEFYSQCSVDPTAKPVSQVDVIPREALQPPRKKYVPVIDISGMQRKKEAKPTSVQLEPEVAEPRPPARRTYSTDIPTDPPPKEPKVPEPKVPETAVVERNMHFQEEPDVTEEHWCTMAVVKNKNYDSFDEESLSPVPSPIDSEVIYEALKESKGVQTKAPPVIKEPTERRVVSTAVSTMTNDTSSNIYERIERTERPEAECKENSTQTNPEIGTQTMPVLEPEINIIENKEQERLPEEDEVTAIYTQIRDVERLKKNSKKKQKDLENSNKVKAKKPSKKEERKKPERTNSTRSNKSVPAVLKPRSELRKQIEPDGIESVDASDSDTSEMSSTTTDTRSSKREMETYVEKPIEEVKEVSDGTSGSESSDEQTEVRQAEVKKEKKKMKRLSRLDQVKKPVVFPTEVYDVKPVPALANLRERPQLLGVFSIKTYSSHPRSKCRPTGLAISPSGNYILSDYSDKTVKIFNKSGQVKVEFGEGNLVKPWGVTLLEDGNVAVSDPGDTSVKIFTRKGKFVKKFEFANLVEPYGITKSNAGDILVADKGANGLYVFDGNGFLKGSLSSPSNDTIAEWPQYVTVDSKDNIIISDYMTHVVRIFSPSGTLLKEHGGMGTGTGQLMCPQGICVDKYGHILVADNINSRVKILSPDGEFIRDLITRKVGLEGPEAVAIDHDGNLVVTEGTTGEVKLFAYVM